MTQERTLTAMTTFRSDADEELGPIADADLHDLLTSAWEMSKAVGLLTARVIVRMSDDQMLAVGPGGLQAMTKLMNAISLMIDENNETGFINAFIQAAGN